MSRPVLGERAMTSAERQAKRREQFRRMREALEEIAQTRSVREAREIAAAALADQESGAARMAGERSARPPGQTG